MVVIWWWKGGAMVVEWRRYADKKKMQNFTLLLGAQKASGLTEMGKHTTFFFYPY